MVKPAFTLVAAFLAGLLGATVQSLLWQNMTQRTVVRANRFELLAPGGEVIGYWGDDQANKATLRFGTPALSDLISFGLTWDDSPFLSLAGNDGRPRVRIDLGRDGNPNLVLSDPETLGRIILGYLPGDAPSPGESTWGLAIREAGSADLRAALLVNRRTQEKVEVGSLYLKDKARVVVLPKR